MVCTGAGGDSVEFKSSVIYHAEKSLIIFKWLLLNYCVYAKVSWCSFYEWFWWESSTKTQKLPLDEFGVKHINILYNTEANKIFSLLDAPNKEAVEKYHEQKYGIKCEWIMEVKTTA